MWDTASWHRVSQQLGAVPQQGLSVPCRETPGALEVQILLFIWINKMPLVFFKDEKCFVNLPLAGCCFWTSSMMWFLAAVSSWWWKMLWNITKVLFLQLSRTAVPLKSELCWYNVFVHPVSDIRIAGAALLREACEALVPNGNSVAVFNSLAWERLEVIQIQDGADKAGLGLLDISNIYIVPLPRQNLISDVLFSVWNVQLWWELQAQACLLWKTHHQRLQSLSLSRSVLCIERWFNWFG